MLQNLAGEQGADMHLRGRDAELSGRRPGAWAAALWVLATAGCLNLDLPTVPQAPPAPFVKIVTPRRGDTVSLTAQVSVEAASVNGIGSLSLLCGPPDGGARTAYSWAAPPYFALVDLSRCEGLTQPDPTDAGALPILMLSAQAFSDAGALQQDSVDVFLNTKGPVLSVQYPPTAQPKAPFTVQVTSDLPLRSFPEVTLDARPASSVTTAQGDAGSVTYSIFFAATPGLGTDNSPYSVGVPVPIEVLTETSRSVRLAVGATAANGNSTQLDLAVDLTRLVWDRYIPGKPAATDPITWAAEPVAFAGGLVLPLATTAPASAGSTWIPGLLRSSDGTFSGFQTSLLPGGLDGGYLARGLNAQGETLFFNFTGNGSNLLLAPPPGSSAAAVTATTGPPSATAPLTRVDGLLCLQDSVTACSVAATESLTCFDTQLSRVTASAIGVSTGPPTPGIVAGAGGQYLSPNISVCGSSWNQANLATGAMSFGPTTDIYTGCPVQGVSKLLPVGDGTFVVQLTINCNVAGLLVAQFPIYRVGPNNNFLGAYTAPQGSPSTSQAELVAALPDGRVVTLSNAPPYTNFELWSLNSTTPDIITPVAGLYDTTDATLGSVLAQSTYSGSDGSFAVLLSGATLGVGVLAFGPNLQPLWLYVYPRVTDAFNSRMVAASNLGDVYFIDQFNNRALSLRARPVRPVSGITVNGLVVNASGAAAAGLAVVVSSAAGTQNTTSDSTGAFTFVGVQTPYTLSAVDLTQREVTSYQGLTIANPTIQHALDQSTFYSAQITTPLDAGVLPSVTELQFVSPEELGTGTNQPPSIGFSWAGPASTTGRITALQLQVSDAGYSPFIPVAFMGYASVAGILVHNGDNLSQSLPLGPISSTGTISGTVTPPSGSTLYTITVSLVSDPTIPAGIPFFQNYSSPPPSFSSLTPNIPGTSLLLQVTTNDTLGNSGYATLVGLPANSPNLTVNIPASPTLLAPANNATGVTTGTQLSCSSFTGGIYHFVLSPDGYGKYDLWSNTPAATIPDLRAAGVPLPPNNSYQWWVEGTAPITSVDQLAAPYTGNTLVGKSAFWNLTTGP